MPERLEPDSTVTASVVPLDAVICRSRLEKMASFWPMSMSASFISVLRLNIAAVSSIYSYRPTFVCLICVCLHCETGKPIFLTMTRNELMTAVIPEKLVLVLVTSY